MLTSDWSGEVSLAPLWIYIIHKQAHKHGSLVTGIIWLLELSTRHTQIV